MSQHAIDEPRTPTLAFSQADAERAHREWGANCGPGALAACLGWTLDAVRPHLDVFEKCGYMDGKAMHRAILAAGFRYFPVPHSEPLALPDHGLVRVQWHGPWMLPGVPMGARCKATHWIAAKRFRASPMIFDINGGWMPFFDWNRLVVPAIVESIGRADGTYSYSHRWEVRKARG